MAHQQLSSQSSIVGPEEQDQEAIDELVASLPQRKGVVRPFQCLYQNFWCPIVALPNVMAFQRYFQAKDKDIVLASLPKSGTTWLKALVFSVVNRSRFSSPNTPVLTSNPHDLVPFLEFQLYGSKPRPDLDGLAEPRLFATHIPYPSLPVCVQRSSDCRIIYICRNPLDIVVSSWHFNLEMARSEGQPEWSLEEHFETYCQGSAGFGPFWEHMVGYWKESLERPHKVLFLKYEDLKEDIVGYLKRVAEFVGLPFTEEEERGGVIEEMAKMCSFKNLQDLEVNRSGKIPLIIDFQKRSFFRKGEVGDWVNHLTPSMVERLNSIMQEKISPFGLQFKTR